MKADKRKKLESAGWRLGDANEFLKLSRTEAQFVEIKLSLVKMLRHCRERGKLTQAQLAKRIGSSQSRVAKMEAGDPSVSVDLLIRSLLAAGADSRQVGRAVSNVRG